VSKPIIKQFSIREFSFPSSALDTPASAINNQQFVFEPTSPAAQQPAMLPPPVEANQPQITEALTAESQSQTSEETPPLSTIQQVPTQTNNDSRPSLPAVKSRKTANQQITNQGEVESNPGLSLRSRVIPRT